MARKKSERRNPHSALRAKALRLMRRRKRAPTARRVEEPARIFNELQVHQVELEVQNEELRRAQQVAEEARAKYSDLFDFAPVGYFMLDGLAVIRELNIAASCMLGRPRRMLLGRLFTSFLDPRSRRVFREFLGRLHREQIQLQCEVVLQVKGRPPVTAQLSGVAFSNQYHHAYIRLAASDITALKASEATLRQMHEEMRRLAASLQGAREEECTRIAREVHDELGQALTLLKLDLAGLEQDLPAGRSDLQDKLQHASRSTDSLIRTVQNIAIRLRPMVLDRFGLLAAMKWWGQEFQSHTGIDWCLELPMEGIPKMDKNREVAAFRIFQEILTNAARHAQATKVTVTLAATAGWFICEVRDNGRGIAPDAAAAAASFGLENMRQRAALVHGEISIHGVAGKGTTVRVAIPFVDPSY